MKIVVHFLLLVSIVSLMVMWFTLFISQDLSDLIISWRLYFSLLFLWRTYPFMIPLVLCMMSIRLAPKIYSGVYKDGGVVIVFVLIGISTTAWAWTHDSVIDFWDDKPMSFVTTQALQVDKNAKIVHEYNNRKDGTYPETWRIVWINNYGLVREMHLNEIGNLNSITRDETSPVTYTDMTEKRKSYVLSDIRELYSETIIAFFYDEIYTLVYNNIVLRMIFYLVVGIAFALGSLLLGLFEFRRETIMSIVGIYTLMSMLLFLFMSNIIILSSAIGIVLVSIIIIRIAQHRRKKDISV